MRPDRTCITGEQTLEPNPRVPSSRRPPCKYHYMKGTTYQCSMFDRLKKEAPQKTPRDLMNEGVFDRLELYAGFLFCVRLIKKNPATICNQCGQCCKMWALKQYALYPDKPCKGKGTLTNPDNPCTKLIDNHDGTFSCAIYGTEEYNKNCLMPQAFPIGTEYDLFEQFLNGTTIGQIKRLMKCPSCVYEFIREP